MYCNGALSCPNEIIVGVPQGSVLGLILFLLFINDITQSLNSNCTCNIFADDVVIYTTGNNIQDINESLQANIDSISAWYECNRLLINPDKTKVMLLKSCRSKSVDRLNVTIKDTRLDQVNRVRYLGVEVDENLTWDCHVRNVCRSVAYKLHSLSRLRLTLNTRLLNTLYKTTIQPCIDYASSTWGNCSVTSRQALFRLHKRAARIVAKNFDYTHFHGEDIIKDLRWQTLEQRRDFYLACLMYKCIHGLAPARLCNIIEMYFDRHGFNTRNANSLNVVIPKPNMECFKQSFTYAGALHWNQIPSAIQNAPSFDHFKNKYKELYFI